VSVPRPLALVVTPNREINQIQQNVSRALYRDGTLGEPTTSARLPAASANEAGKVYRVKDNGQPETVKVCLQNSDGSYAWAVLVIAPA
jgi:hypothetical protein